MNRLAFGILLIAVPVMAGNLVQNGSFEDPVISYNQFVNSIPDWTATNTATGLPDQFEIWGQGFLGVTGYDGQQLLELEVSNPTTISQELTGLIPGETYEFSMAIRDRPWWNEGSDYDVYFGGNLLGSYETFDCDNWTVVTAEFIASAGSGTLAIAGRSHVGHNGIGALVDMVSVTGPSGVPEPASLFLLLPAAALLFLRKRAR